MAFYAKNSQEPTPEVETTIWSCTNDDCKGWMREAYTFAETPTCPMCHAPMQKETRILPELT